MAPNFEVYQLEHEAGDLTEPIHTVVTEAKGLNASVYKDDARSCFGSIWLGS